MSLSYAAHINGDKVYDIATGYWIEAKQEAAASEGRMTWAVYLYDDTGTFVEKYAVGSFPEADKDKWLFAGFDMNLRNSDAAWRIFNQVMPSYSVSLLGSGTSSTLKQYFSGEQGYAINADYAVIDVQPYSITENGTYTAPFSKAYSPVTVDVQEQPWQPLEDGYSNFWFELTNDTLSPWLNFSAKTDDAVIDWGDGSGEVALDTLTPTHTYAKAGKYVVKVKGVTGIARQHLSPVSGKYLNVLKHVELNSEVTTIQAYGLYLSVGLIDVALANREAELGQNAFYNCTALLNVTIPAVTTLANSLFQQCYSLTDADIPSGVEMINQNMFYQCYALKSIALPDTVASIGNLVFAYCTALSEVHIAAVTPPTLGTGVFSSASSSNIIYVPVGTGDTYKAASGWSTYADHILEEGQTPNRAMLSRLAKAVETDTDEDMR